MDYETVITWEGSAGFLRPCELGLQIRGDLVWAADEGPSGPQPAVGPPSCYTGHFPASC